MGEVTIENILTVMSVVSGILVLILGLTVFRGSAPWAHRWTFSLFSVCAGQWAIFIGLFYMIDNLSLAYYFVPLYYIFSLFIAVGLLLFCLSYSTVKLSNFYKYMLFVPVVVMSILIALPRVFIEQIEISPVRTVQLNDGLYLIFASLFSLYAISSLVLMLSSRLMNKTFKYRKLIATIFAVALSGGAFFNLVLPFFGVYSGHIYGPLFILIIVGTFSYLVMQRGLFDIRMAVSRSVAYILALITVATVYSFVWYVIYSLFMGGNQKTEEKDFLLNILALTVLTSLFFQPIKNFFDRITSRYFYRGSYTVEGLLSDLSYVLTSTSDLRALLSRSATVIASNLKSSQVSLFVWYGEDNGKYLTSGSEGYSIMPRDDAEFLARVLKDQKYIQSSEVFDKDFRRLLISHGLEIVIPLRSHDQTFGFLCIGEKQSGHYSKRDLEALFTILDEIIIAIQNTISTQRVRELNEGLQQRINEATSELRSSNKQLQKLDHAKDEFLSMASHQLRTPLTSVKGYISMVLDGDVGDVNAGQRKLLNEAFINSERMVHLINDFLSVSRLQTQKFVVETHPVDVVKMVKQEVNSLKTMASARGLKISFKSPRNNVPMLLLDEAKMRQVVMNYIDNALFYSTEGTTIDVSLSFNRGEVVLKVIDTGIGVPRAERSQLFTKFYRASNAKKRRPDGTGVGLYLAKKVIDAHGGRVLFESVENKGSTFGFVLPAKKLLAKDNPK